MAIKNWRGTRSTWFVFVTIAFFTVIFFICITGDSYYATQRFLLTNCCVIYRQIFSTCIPNKSLKLSFALNCVLRRTNDLKTTCFRNLKPFLINGNRCRILQTHNRDITDQYLFNLVFSVWTVLAFSPTIYGPRASRLGHKSKGKKLGP